MQYIHEYIEFSLLYNLYIRFDHLKSINNVISITWVGMTG